MIYEAFVFTGLALSDSVTSNIKGLTVSQKIELSDQVETNLKPQGASSVLRIDHLATAAKTLNLAAAVSLVFQQSANPRTSIIVVDQLLFVWQDQRNDGFAPLVRSQLVLTQSAVGSLAKAAYDTLALTQSVVVTKTLNITVAQTAALISNVTGYLPDKYWSSYEITVIEP